MHEIAPGFVDITVHLFVVGCTSSITKLAMDIPRHRNFSPWLFRAAIKYWDGIHCIAAVAGCTANKQKMAAKQHHFIKICLAN